MSEKYINVIVSMNVEQDAFSISFVRSKQEKILSDSFKSFKVIDLKLSDLLGERSFEAERVVGNTILSICRKLSYLKENEIESEISNKYLDEVNELLLEKASSDDPGAQFELAIFYMNVSVDRRDERLLEEAESLLNESSISGYEEATAFLINTWPDLKVAYMNLIKGKQR